MISHRYEQHKRALLTVVLQDSGSQVFVTAIASSQLKEMPPENYPVFNVENRKVARI